MNTTNDTAPATAADPVEGGKYRRHPDGSLERLHQTQPAPPAPASASPIDYSEE
jgi:hypothetical protein